MKWRFLISLAVLVISLISSVVEWAVNHNKVTGLRKKAAAVICCVVSVFFMTVSTAPALPFVDVDNLPASGEYNAEEIDGIIAERFVENFFGFNADLR